MMLKKHSRSIIRFLLAMIMIIVGMMMLQTNLIAGIFSLAVAAYALTSGILWLRVENRPDNGGNVTSNAKHKK